VRVGRLTLVVLVAAGSGVAPSVAQVWQIAVAPTVATVPQAALDQLTKGIGVAPPEPIPLTVTWTSAASEPLHVSLQLRLNPGASIVGELGQTVVFSVEGKLWDDSAQPREWAVEQENFGTWLAHAQYLPNAHKLTLILPVAFAPRQPPAAEKVHAVLLIPCRLKENQLSCPAARLAFRETVQRHFPGEAKAEEVLSPYLTSAEETVPGSTMPS
jgi:hypothetical protein